MTGTVRIAPDEYLRLDLRVHELLREIPLYDVSAVDLPGGGAGRTVVELRALQAAAPPSRVSEFLYGLRYFLGRVFGWDREPIRPEASMLSRLSADDRRQSDVPPGTRCGAFLILYEFPMESLAETRNATVHGFICTALAPAANGYRMYWGVYVRHVSWLTRPYLMLIEPFRRVLYPAMLRRIRRAWIARYGSAPTEQAAG